MSLLFTSLHTLGNGVMVPSAYSFAARSARLERTCDPHRQPGTIVLSCRHIFDLANGQHALNHLSEHDVLPIEKVALLERDEEL